MPGRFERHARAKSDGWGTESPRSAQLGAIVSAEIDLETPLASPRRQRAGRKDTRRWCKGRPGRPHVPVIVLDPMYPGRSCHPAREWMADLGLARDDWECSHRERCERCGRVLRDRDALGRDCPDYLP